MGGLERPVPPGPWDCFNELRLLGEATSHSKLEEKQKMTGDSAYDE
ncbi:hypothetical protein THTE_2793 [Thermogutta terrifontis]|uniref:Uncharacterized protein n=1 Tax=Thermogutta terrifontis TaxID=1331910 RepID=A0A286RHE2_9BACT|nr:hypothetical protein THTE_2793 [Thermogutta terrifontis]